MVGGQFSSRAIALEPQYWPLKKGFLGVLLKNRIKFFKFLRFFLQSKYTHFLYFFLIVFLTIFRFTLYIYSIRRPWKCVFYFFIETAIVKVCSTGIQIKLTKIGLQYFISDFSWFTNSIFKEVFQIYLTGFSLRKIWEFEWLLFLSGLEKSQENWFMIWFVLHFHNRYLDTKAESSILQPWKPT